MRNLTENQQAYRAKLSEQYEGDAQGFYAAECIAMLAGKLPLDLTQDHIQATSANNKAIVDNFAESTREAF